MCYNFKGYHCMRWLVASMILSFILILVIVGLHVVLGGPIPTFYLATAAKLLYTSNVVIILACTIALIIILKFTEKLVTCNIRIRWAIFGVVNALLLIAFIVNLCAVVSFSFTITAKDVIEYSTDYRTNYQMMPPQITKMEKWSQSLSVEQLPMGCCGHSGFGDHVDVSLSKNACLSQADYKQDPRIKFSAPQSCCKEDRNVKGVTHKYCEDPKELEDNKYVSYDAQLYMQHLFIKIAKNAKSFNDIKKEATRMGQNFADWITGEHPNPDGSKTKKTFPENELPPSDGTINFKPKFDCAYPMKAQFKEYLGDWDNEAEWESNPESSKDAYGNYHKNKHNAAENYLESVRKEVKTSVLGCGALLELLLGDNIFAEVVLSNKHGENLRTVVSGIKGLRGFIVGFIVVVILLTILNLVWFNYYYVPLVLFPNRWMKLPFYPKKNEVTPSKATVAAVEMAPAPAAEDLEVDSEVSAVASAPEQAEP